MVIGHRDVRFTRLPTTGGAIRNPSNLMYSDTPHDAQDYCMMYMYSMKHAYVAYILVKKQQRMNGWEVTIKILAIHPVPE